jgi:colanic acid/amylovoran biosynthesis glycosyltransferase
MRIAYVVAEFPSLSETFILREISALVERGVDVRIFALKPPASGTVHAEAAALADRVVYGPGTDFPGKLLRGLVATIRSPRAFVRGTRSVRLPGQNSPAMWLRSAWTCIRALSLATAARKAGIDRIHAHFAFHTTDVATLIAQWLHVPCSVSVHARDIYTQIGPVLSWRLHEAGLITACTVHGRDHLLRSCPGIAPERVRLVRHGLRPDEYEATSGDGPFVLAVGRLEEKKGFSYLLEACGILKERGVHLQLTIVGEGTQNRTLRDLAERLSLDDRVVFAGALEQFLVEQLYRQAQVFVLPSVVASDGDHDGLPNVLLEAGAMSLPVVSTTVGGIPEFVTDGENGFLVPQRDAETLADRIETLLGDADLRERMGAAGRKRVAAEFDISRNVDDLMRSFSETGNGTGPSPFPRTATGETP